MGNIEKIFEEQSHLILNGNYINWAKKDFKISNPEFLKNTIIRSLNSELKTLFEYAELSEIETIVKLKSPKDWKDSIALREHCVYSETEASVNAGIEAAKISSEKVYQVCAGSAIASHTFAKLKSFNGYAFDKSIHSTNLARILGEQLKTKVEIKTENMYDWKPIYDEKTLIIADKIFSKENEKAILDKVIENGTALILIPIPNNIYTGLINIHQEYQILTDKYIEHLEKTHNVTLTKDVGNHEKLNYLRNSEQNQKLSKLNLIKATPK